MRRSILLLSACLLASTAGAQVATPRLKTAPVAQPSPGGRPGAEAIGPKQDDPRAPQGIIVQGGREAIGPKQDDPRAPQGLVGEDGIGPGGGCEGSLAIGPKQDDPSSGATARPGDDEDPKAAGGTGVLAIGPKQDDPRAALAARHGAQAIGPKQDDPARPGAAAVARPGDDEDPKARCVPTGR
ncbi:MAG: hypothetical protein ACOY9B_09350 [Pseudomonadota bacterium]